MTSLSFDNRMLNEVCNEMCHSNICESNQDKLDPAYDGFGRRLIATFFNSGLNAKLSIHATDRLL